MWSGWKNHSPPRGLMAATAIFTVLALVPLAFIMRARTTNFGRPRIHVIPDMDQQPTFRMQEAAPFFADGRAMRLPVEGVVAQGDLEADDHFYRGRSEGDWADTFPMPVTEALMRRGGERFDIYCATCHGLAGGGDGITAKRADKLEEGTWTPPASYHTELVRGRPVGHLFDTITHGVRNMPSYASQIPPEDRWAIVAYVRALQRSQNASIEDVPPDMRQELR